MKKILALILSVCFVLSLGACQPVNRLEAGAGADQTDTTAATTLPSSSVTFSSAPPVTVPKNTEGPPVSTSGLTEQETLIQSMKQAYMQIHSKDPVTIEQLGISYFGGYGENHVAYFHCSCNYTQALREEVYGDLVFRFNNGQQLYVYRNGALEILSIAVEKGWFTQDELAQLHAYLYS